jgi:O-antigen ligase
MAFLMPFARTGSSVPMVIMILNFLVEGGFNEKWKRVLQPRWLVLPCLYFLVQLIAVFYSSNIAEGLAIIEKKSSLCYLVIIISSVPLLIKQDLRKIAMALIAGVGIMSLFAVARGLYFYATGGTWHLTYGSLIDFSNMHPGYLSMYVVSCIVLLVGKLSEVNSSYPKYKIIGLLALLSWFFVFCFLLQARTALIFLIIYSLVAIPYILIRKGKMKLAISGLLVLLSVMSIAFWKIPALKERFTSMNKVSYHSKDQTRYINSDNSRASMWEASWNIIKRYPLTGTGTGDFTAQLKKEFRRIGFLKYKHMQSISNAHNQSLQSWGSAGIAGILSYLLMSLVPLYLAIKQKDPLYIALFAMFFITNITECMLEAQSGVVFFAMLICLYPARIKAYQYVSVKS